MKNCFAACSPGITGRSTTIVSPSSNALTWCQQKHAWVVTRRTSSPLVRSTIVKRVPRSGRHR